MPISSKTRAVFAPGTKLIGVALVASLVATACATAPGAVTMNSTGATDHPATEIEALYWERIDNMRTRFTEADVRFMTGLIAIRAQDRVMTELAMSQGDDPRVRLLARRILSNQEDEVVLIREWLRARGQSIPDLQARGAMRLADGADRVGYVMGMVSSQQFENLQQAIGPAFDRLFLTYSIQHHIRAEMLVYTLLRSGDGGQDPTVFRLASAVQGEQAAQVARMEDMLLELSAAGGDR